MNEKPNLNKWKDWRLASLIDMEKIKLNEAKDDDTSSLKVKEDKPNPDEKPEEPKSIPLVNEFVKKVGGLQFAFTHDKVSFRNTNFFDWKTLKEVCAEYESWLESESKKLEKTAEIAKYNKREDKKSGN